MDPVPDAPASAPVPVPGRNCWRVETAPRAGVVIDAADYFLAVQDALSRARKQILLIGWDFDTRICLDGERTRDSVTLGDFILGLAKKRPELEIRILKWNLGALKILGRGSMMLTTLRWIRHRGITLRLDSAHPVGASHHQKVVVIDDAFAFCGGIDITSGRWDTPEHLDEDPRRRAPDGTLHHPWHDITLGVDGAAARALGELARARWQHATGKQLAAPECTGDPWPECLTPTFRDVSVAIARTRSEHGDADEVRENESLYLEMIASAKRFIYMENQYFASRAIADAIALRMQEENPPEVVLVMPECAEGWLEHVAMDTARAQMMERVARTDHRCRFRIYHPVAAGGTPIYVHAKLTIVDDEIIRVGSANLNNRSMGLDSECDMAIDSRLPAGPDTRRAIRRIRLRLLAEHLGRSVDEVEKLDDRGSLIALVEALRGEGRSLRAVVPEEPGPAMRALPVDGLMDPGDDGEPVFERMARRRWRGWRRRW